MNPSTGYAKAKKYVDSHSKLSVKEIEKLKKKFPGPCLTISRQCGIETQSLCENLVNELTNIYSNEWAYFDKNLLEKVVNDYKLPPRIQKYLTERRQSALSLMLNELLGIHPPVLELIHKMSKTIFKLAEFGNVIIVGRGANMITAQLKNSFHIRLISPLNNRISELETVKGITKETAKKIILMEDKNRKDFFMRNFRRDIDDPEIYNMVINISSYNHIELVEIIKKIIKTKFPLQEYSKDKFGLEGIKH